MDAIFSALLRGAILGWPKGTELAAKTSVSVLDPGREDGQLLLLQGAKAHWVVLGAGVQTLPRGRSSHTPLPDTAQSLRQRQRSDGSGAAFRAQLCGEGVQGAGVGDECSLSTCQDRAGFAESISGQQCEENHR